MVDFYLRTESIRQEEILGLYVHNEVDRNIVDSLMSPEPCLLEGSRGTGKSFLMRVAELSLEDPSRRILPIFVSFNISSLLRTNDPLQFYHWMLAKTLKVLTNKLRKQGLLVSRHSANLLSNDESDNSPQIETNLKEIVKAFENSYRGTSNIDPSYLPDIEDTKEAIEHICKDNGLERVFFFFDEAAHVFRPEQQRQFFNLFKDLRSPYITCNAAIYPGVTYFGDSFEPLHDCIYKKLERDIRSTNYIEYFKEIVFRQADDSLQNEITRNFDLFSTMAYSCSGTPRMLLRTIQDLTKFKSTAVNETIKHFYRHQIWAEHTELGEKYKGHKILIDWGRDFLENFALPAIENYNVNRKEKSVDESSIYFWIHKDVPETVKESLRLLTYTGIIRKIDSSIRATRSELGDRFEVKYGCIISLFGSPVGDSKQFYNSLSVKKFPEFGKNHVAFTQIKDLDGVVDNEQTFKTSLQHMLKKPISVLQTLTEWQQKKLKEIDICTIEELHQNSEADLMAKICHVGPVRARLIKNAVNAELLEYLSG